MNSNHSNNVDLNKVSDDDDDGDGDGDDDDDEDEDDDDEEDDNTSIKYESIDEPITLLTESDDLKASISSTEITNTQQPSLSSSSSTKTDSDASLRYTNEQKIVAAVWVHEKHYNKQTWREIRNNFRIRFNTTPPIKSTLAYWEEKLFRDGYVQEKPKTGRPLARLMHVPYVKASVDEQPDLSLNERSKILGLPRTTLLKILRDDLGITYRNDGDKIDDSGKPLKKWKKDNS